MRRVSLEALVLGAVLLGLGLLWSGADVLGGTAAPGALAGKLAWQHTLLDQALSGNIPGTDMEPAVWTALPVVLTASLFGALLPDPLAVSLAMLVWLAAGPAVLWAIVRARSGTSPLAAAGAAIVGGLAPVVMGGLLEGRAECLAVPLVALAIHGATSDNRTLRVVGFLATVFAGTFHTGLGLATALGAAIAGGGGGSLLAGLLVLTFGAADPATTRHVELLDVAAPFLSFRPDAEAVGLGALLALVWFLPASPARRAAILGFVYALGPVVPFLSQIGIALPVPGLLQGLLSPADLDWSGGLVVGSTAVGLALGRPGFATTAVLFPIVTLVELLRVSGGVVPTTTLTPPLLLTDLTSRDGGVLHLPVEVLIPALPTLTGAPPGSHALYLSFQPSHGRALPFGLAPLGAAHPLYAEPGVLLLLDLVGGAGTLLLPPLQPGDTLRGLGVTDLVVHRGRLPESALAALDPVFARWYGPPQRDLPGAVDLYRVPETGVRYPTKVTPLHRVGDADAVGWKSSADYLAEHGLRPASTQPAGGAARPGGPRPGEPGGKNPRPPGAPPDGASPDGSPPNGSAPNLSPPNGSPSNGSPPNGAPPRSPPPSSPPPAPPEEP